jgi:hypothetical protein
MGFKTIPYHLPDAFGFSINQAIFIAKIPLESRVFGLT